MNAPSTMPLLLGLTAGLLALLVAGGLFALRLQKAQRRFAARVELVTAEYVPVVAAAVATRRSARRTDGTEHVLHRVLLWLAYDTTRPEQYLAQWWLVLPVGVIVARLGVQLLIPLIGSIGLVLVPVGGLLLTRQFFLWCLKRRRQALYSQFPDALAMIVRGVRVGIPVAESMRVIAREAPEPTAPEFRRVADRVALGAVLENALFDMAERNSLAEYRFFASAIGLQSQTGGGLSETLDNLGDVIRKRVALRARGMALASEARTSIVILCGLPVVDGLLMFLLNPAYIGRLFDNDLGKKVFAGAIVLFIVGLTSMQVIVKKSLS